MTNQAIGDGVRVCHGHHQERVLLFPARGDRVEAQFLNSLGQLSKPYTAFGANPTDALRNLSRLMEHDAKNGAEWAAKVREAGGHLHLTTQRPVGQDGQRLVEMARRASGTILPPVSPIGRVEKVTEFIRSLSR